MGQKFNFNAMQSVKVNDENLEHHGQAGYVVEAVDIDGDDTDSTVSVKIDTDNTVYEFDPRVLVAL